MALAQNIQQRLQNVFAAYPEVKAVYVFGSYASGTSTKESDLDLGVVGGDSSSLKVDILADLVEEGFESVDLVFLDQVNPIVRFEAVRHNVVAYHDEDFDLGSYFSRALREYFDLEPLLKRQREAYKRHLQERG